MKETEEGKWVIVRKVKKKPDRNVDTVMKSRRKIDRKTEQQKMERVMKAKKWKEGEQENG